MLAATARYAAFLIVAVAAPGLALQRLAGLSVETAVVLPLGFAFAAAAYWISLVTGQPWLFPAAVALVDLVLLWRGLGRRAAGPSLRGAAAPAAALVLLLALTQYPWNRVSAAGEFLLDPLVAYDTAFHVGLVRELTLGYPPQVPGVAGFPLGYHLGTDLVRAAALRWADVDPYDSISRFDVTVFALALLLAVRAAAARAGLSPTAIALAGWTLVATDFSFAFAANPQAHWWADLLRGNILLSLALANPVVPALALALGALIALSRAVEGEGGGWWAMAAASAAAVPFFKVFLGAHLALGLLVAFFRAPRTARGGVAAVTGLVGAATLALALGEGGRTVAVTFAPLDLVRVTRDSLGLLPIGGVRLVMWASLWVAASLGLRLAGLPEAVRALRRSEVLAPALAAMALAAWPLGLLFRVSAPEMLEGQKAVNDAAYLVEQGGPLLWIFAAGALAGWTRERAPRLIALMVLLAGPSTLQFVAKKATTPPDPLPAPMVRAMRALAAASLPGEIVLQRPGARYPPAPVILVGRRVAYERFTPWLTQFAPAAALESRHAVVYRFFHTANAEEAMAIADMLGARYVALYGGDRVLFDPAGRLQPLFEEDGARLYRIRR